MICIIFTYTHTHTQSLFNALTLHDKWFNTDEIVIGILPASKRKLAYQLETKQHHKTFISKAKENDLISKPFSN